MKTLAGRLGDLYENSQNPVDRAFLKVLIDIDIFVYTMLNLYTAARVKYWCACALAYVKLRPPVSEELDFPELFWEFD